LTRPPLFYLFESLRVRLAHNSLPPNLVPRDRFLTTALSTCLGLFEFVHDTSCSHHLLWDEDPLSLPGLKRGFTRFPVYFAETGTPLFVILGRARPFPPLSHRPSPDSPYFSNHFCPCHFFSSLSLFFYPFLFPYYPRTSLLARTLFFF